MNYFGDFFCFVYFIFILYKLNNNSSTSIHFPQLSIDLQILIDDITHLLLFFSFIIVFFFFFFSFSFKKNL
ncbi:hypothetical protein BY996DRAFT_7305150, partial [Phakopsora pachyrhizi]